MSSNQSNLVVVKCPECGLKLSFKAVPNYKLKPITCPKCHHADRVENFDIVSDPADKQIGTADQTNIIGGGDPGSSDTRPINQATIKCIDTGEEYQLNLGDNTVGRRASDNKADIVFTDRELYMSRRHASIKFIISNGVAQFQLRDEGSANGTFVKGTRIPEKSIVRLNSGDKFKMGQLTFVCTSNDNVTSRFRGAYSDGDTVM